MTNYTINSPQIGDYKSILSIIDSNIIVNRYYEDYLIDNKNNLSRKMVKIFEGELFFNNDFCPVCGAKHPKVYKKDSKISNIKIPRVSGYQAILRLKKNRYTCLSCNKSFTPSCSVVNKGCLISNAIKQQIALSLKEIITCTFIAKSHDVSTNTVFRVLDEYYKSTIKTTYKKYLPSILHFDELKSTKDAKGNMSFVMIDGTNNKLLDIVENRQKSYLINYFKYYTEKAKNNVKYIVIDMYTPYMELIKEVFPKATIVLDRFHIYQNLTRSFNKTRVEIMNKYKGKPLYNQLKNYWKVLLQSHIDLSTPKYKNRQFDKKWLSNNERVNLMLESDIELEKNYDKYQKIFNSLRYKDIEAIKEALYSDSKGINPKIKTCINTFKKYLDYIETSITVPYNNGVIEGKISKMKRLKTISCGFRKFNRFRTRIMLIENLINVGR